MPLLLPLIGFIVGAGMVVFLPDIFSLPLFISKHPLVFGIPCAVIFYWRHRVSGLFSNIVLVLLALGVGFVWSSGQLNTRIERQLPISLESQDLDVSLVVAALPEVYVYRNGRPPSTRFTAEIFEADWSGLDSCKVKLYWRNAPSLVPGSHWKAVVRLKRPRGFVNPGGFDYQAWLLRQKFCATGYIVTASHYLSRQPHDGSVWVDRYALEKARLWLADTLFSDSNTPTTSATKIHYAAIFKALVLGDKSAIGVEQWDVFSRTGTIHLMAISGLHIGLVAGLGLLLGRAIVLLLFFLENLCRGLSQRLGLWSYRGQLGRVWARTVPSFFSVLASLSYAALAGFSIPTIRALTLVVLLNLAFMLGRRTSIFHALLLAAAIIIALDPFALLQRGFWLSFAAVVCLLVVFSSRTRRNSTLLTVSLSQVAVFIGLSLPLALLGLPISILSPFANVFAIPLMSFVIIPVLFLATIVSVIDPQWSQLLLALADTVFHWLWLYLENLASAGAEDSEVAAPSSYSSVVWVGGEMSVAQVALAIFSLMLLALPEVLRLRLLGATLLGVAIFSPVISGLAQSVFTSRIDTGAENNKEDLTLLELTVLDVGQGLSVVFRAGEHSYVYDVGAKFSPQFDIGRRVIAPFLRARGVSYLNGVFISHWDNDHGGGLPGLRSVFPIARLLAGPKDSSSPQSIPGVFQPLSEPCDSHLGWRIPRTDVSIRALWPRANEPLSKKRNNRSCVLYIETGEFSVLLVGDIEAKVERALLKAGVLPDSVDILLAPHHGSKSSSTQAFVEHVAPKHVIFSAGYKNRFGHPAAEVRQRYLDIGARLWNTAEHGAISVFPSDDKALSVVAERVVARKPWYRLSEPDISEEKPAVTGD